MSLTIARRYAQALYEEAESRGCIDRVDEDVAMMQASLEGSLELQRFFPDPVISIDKKEAVVEALFTGRVHDLVLSFLKLLLRKGRGALVGATAVAYQAMRDEQLGIVEAHVRTALKLSSEEEKSLEEGLEKMTGRQVRLKTRVDASILGGLIIRVGDTVYDRSVLNQLSALRGRLENSTFSVN